MKALTIKDLARTEQLDRAAMSAVRGGHMAAPVYSVGNISYTPSYDSSIHGIQNLMQGQSVFNGTADGSAFVSDVSAVNTTEQFGQNNIVQY
ncbi:hypothetical protein Q4S45_19195 [Massilia sp. R2A-15]|uniref:hypothetical protein n=1 Tax=Massilia sp. R2A-15 TaxID=3064278 RepID=UPI0027337F2D|nr:hypothetical protein [Massilia sp. R2A-15]WLI88810.1 hypothetical protein Q4S45_19195 [Massilia sp. R2A-15]